MNKAGVVDQDDPKSKRGGTGVKLLDSPLGTEFGRLEDGVKVTVVEELPGRWYHVVSQDGRSGYVKGQFITFAPENDPEASLYRITGDDNVGFFHLLSARYGHFEERNLLRLKLGAWGSDARFYARVVAHVNRRPEINRDYVKGPFKEKRWIPGSGGVFGDVGRVEEVENWVMIKGGRIWLPGKTYADALHGTIPSGSPSYEAKEKVVGFAKAVWSIIREIPPFVAGVVVGGLEHLGNMAADLVKMAWGLLKSLITGSVLSDARQLVEALAKIAEDPGKLLAALGQELYDRWKEGWYSRGKLVGAFLVEALIMILSVGTVTAARGAAWVKRLWDLIKMTKAGPILANLERMALVKGGKEVAEVKSWYSKTVGAVGKALSASHEWARTALRLPVSILKELTEDAVNVLRRLSSSAAETFRRLGVRDKLRALGCNSPCPVPNLARMERDLAAVKKERAALDAAERASLTDKRARERGRAIRDEFEQAQGKGSRAAQEAELKGRPDVKETAKPGGKPVPQHFDVGNFSHNYAEHLIDERRLPRGLEKEFRVELPGQGEIRLDRVDLQNGIIYEIKPDTPASRVAGKQQIEKYIHYMNREYPLGPGRSWTGRVVTYDQRTVRRVLRRIGWLP